MSKVQSRSDVSVFRWPRWEVSLGKLDHYIDNMGTSKNWQQFRDTKIN